MPTQARKQMVGDKRRAQCEEILKVPVRSAFMNGTLPHHVALAWTGPREASLVHLKNRKAVEYVKDGKFLMHRAFIPIKVWVPDTTLPHEGVLPCENCSQEGMEVVHCTGDGREAPCPMDGTVQDSRLIETANGEYMEIPEPEHKFSGHPSVFEIENELRSVSGWTECYDMT